MRAAAGFRRECINLVCSLSNIAKEAFNRIGTANGMMHHLWEDVKRQQMLTRVR